MENKIEFGTVKFFAENKGFGFIIDNSNNQEIFMHVNNFKDQNEEFQEGDKVSFTVVRTEKGLSAENVARE